MDIVSSPDYQEFRIALEICEGLLESRPKIIRETWGSFFNLINKRVDDRDDITFIDLYNYLCMVDKNRYQITPETLGKMVSDEITRLMDEERDKILPIVEKYIKKKDPTFLLSKSGGQHSVCASGNHLFYCSSFKKGTYYENIIYDIRNKVYHRGVNNLSDLSRFLREIGYYYKSFLKIPVTITRIHYPNKYKIICNALSLDLDKDLKEAIRIIGKYMK